jgi:hypothetical protein
MAKGQKRSNREPKKPKKAAAPKPKAGSAPELLRSGRPAGGNPPRR